MIILGVKGLSTVKLVSPTIKRSVQRFSKVAPHFSVSVAPTNRHLFQSHNEYNFIAFTCVQWSLRKRRPQEHIH